jgi:hypothetical protein
MWPPQSGSGPRFDFEPTVVADANAHATATTRTNVLTARFMTLSPYMRVPWERKP